MDRRIRELERQGDPASLLRAGQLRCKAEGCLIYKIESLSTWDDYIKQRWMIHLDLSDGIKMDIPIVMKPYYRQESIEYLVRTQIVQHIAKCPRCGMPNDMDIHYTRGIIDGLKRLQNEHERYEPGPGPFGSRQSLLPRGYPPRSED